MGDPRAWAKARIDAGLPVDGPKTAGRERDDGARVEWDMVFVGTEEEGERQVHPFAISDRTPRERRVTPTPSVAEGPLTGVADVVVAVPDLHETVGMLRRTYRLPTPETWEDEAFGARLASFPGQPLTLASPLDDSWLAERLETVGAGPCAYLLGSEGLDAACDAYDLSEPTTWGDERVAWVDSDLLGTTVGVVEE